MASKDTAPCEKVAPRLREEADLRELDRLLGKYLEADPQKVVTPDSRRKVTAMIANQRVRCGLV